MTAILEPADPAAALLSDVHAAGDRQIASVQHLAAERDFERRWRESLEVEIAALMHQNRELRKANEAWRARFEDLERTVELPKLPAEPEPKRRGRWRR